MKNIEDLVSDLLQKPKSVFAVVSTNEETVLYLGQSKKEAEDIIKEYTRKCILQQYEPLTNGSVAQIDYTPTERKIKFSSVHWNSTRRGTYHDPQVIQNIFQELYSKLKKKTD